MFFTSDNAAGAHPAILEALGRASEGPAGADGNDHNFAALGVLDLQGFFYRDFVKGIDDELDTVFNNATTVWLDLDFCFRVGNPFYAYENFQGCSPFIVVFRIYCCVARYLYYPFNIVSVHRRPSSRCKKTDQVL